MLQDKIDYTLSAFTSISSLTIIMLINEVRKGLSTSFNPMFTVTKEMSYIKLNHETMTKGRMIVELVGMKIGIILATIPIPLISMISPNITTNTLVWILCLIFTALSIAWIWSVRSLSKY